MINKRDISRPRTTNDIEMRYQLSQISEISNKVDVEQGKGLSTNDFTNLYKENVENNTKARHIHNNVSLLNSLNENDISKWNKATSDTLYTLFDGNSTGDIDLEDISYDFFIIFYGNSNYVDSKIIYYNNKTFCLSLTTTSDVKSEFYTFTENTIQKKSSSSNITIFKIIAYKKGVDN